MIRVGRVTKKKKIWLLLYYNDLMYSVVYNIYIFFLHVYVYMHVLVAISEFVNYIYILYILYIFFIQYEFLVTFT